MLISLSIFIILQLSYNKHLLSWAKTAQEHQKSRTKNFLETFSAIKEIKIFGKENLFYDLMNSFNQKFFNANRNQDFSLIFKSCYRILHNSYNFFLFSIFALIKL